MYELKMESDDLDVQRLAEGRTHKPGIPQSN
jgi:hypothetical protein